MDARTSINQTIWQTGLRGGHVESYFLKLNDAAQNKAFWIKFTLLCPKGKPEDTVAEVWGIAFDSATPEWNQAFKETYPVASVKLAQGDAVLKFGASSLEPGRTQGRLTGPAGELTWDLTYTAGQNPLVPFPLGWMYTAKVPKSKTKTPYTSSRFTGTFTLNGETITVNGVPGMQGHNWGSEHSHLYAWSHCSAFDGMGDDTFFEGFSSRVKIGPLVTPYLSMAALQLRGTRYVFNDLKAIRSPEVRVQDNQWDFHLLGATHSLRGSISAPKNQFMALKYYNPNGALSYCLNSKVAGGFVELLDGRGTLIERLVARQTIALEVLVKHDKHGVRVGV
jgi:hypothetical protein